MEVARDNLTRMVDFAAEASSDGLTLEGYGAVFNEWTMIEDRQGAFREQIAPGAFKRTINARMPVLQFDHGAHPLIGSIPLGRITDLSEDSRGLFVRARLSDNWLVEPVRDAIRDGGVTGMSFRFSVLNDEWRVGDDKTEERIIREVRLFEVGPVVWPAYDATTVGVRSRQTALALQDPEVRTEVARILALGTDLRFLEDESPATNDTPAVSVVEAPAVSHAATRSPRQREALVALRLAEKD
jgi:HK97 family phage prohead protease